MTNAESPTPQSKPAPRLGGAAIAALCVAAVVGGSVLYGMFGGSGKEAANGQCTASKAVAERIAPLARGEVAAVTVAKAPRPMAELAFEGAGGAKRKLSEFRGKSVLLNLWATWCIPCREEMPALDRLQARLGDAHFEVVAISIDTARLDRRQAFLDDAAVKSLGFYADPTAEVFQILKRNGKVVGLPTTILIDASGCEIAQMPGPADWASEDAFRLIAAAKGV